MKRPLIINNHLILKQRPVMLGVGFVLLLAVLACNMGAAQTTATPAVVTMVVTQSSPVCGDGVCTAPEDATTCAADCAAGAAATVAPEDSGAQVKTTQELNVRFGPSPHCLVLGSYPKDSEVDVLAKNPGGQWWQVPFGTSVGWISAAYTSPVTDLTGVPEIPGPYCAPPTATPVPPTETPIPPSPTPAPVCGNGVIESGEECDTTDTCGGISICSSSCTCKLPVIVTFNPPILLTPIIISP